MKKSLRSPLGKAKGLGANGIGSEHFNAQRFLAVLLVPLVLWFIFCTSSLVLFGTYEDTVDYFSTPLHVIFIALFISAAFYHAAIGLQNVWEDYIHCRIGKVLMIYASRIFCIVAAASGVLAVLSIFFKG